MFRSTRSRFGKAKTPMRSERRTNSDLVGQGRSLASAGEVMPLKGGAGRQAVQPAAATVRPVRCVAASRRATAGLPARSSVRRRERTPSVPRAEAYAARTFTRTPAQASTQTPRRSMSVRHHVVHGYQGRKVTAAERKSSKEGGAYALPEESR